MYYLQYWIVTMYIYSKKYISEANILFCLTASVTFQITIFHALPGQ